MTGLATILIVGIGLAFSFYATYVTEKFKSRSRKQKIIRREDLRDMSRHLLRTTLLTWLGFVAAFLLAFFIDDHADGLAATVTIGLCLVMPLLWAAFLFLSALYFLRWIYKLPFDDEVEQSDDFMEDREQPALPEREDLFE